MRIAYFVHDLADPGIAKRVTMLKAGGGELVVIGFHRGKEDLPSLDAETTIDLGRTYDARFGQRIVMVLSGMLRLRTMWSALAGVDVILARSLEMLLLASVWRWLVRSETGLVYECLDVHRLLLSKRWSSLLLRGLERWLMRSTALLIVSSPAFVSSYFEPFQGLGARLRVPWRLLENKVFDRRPIEARRERPKSGAPWKIGWFGAIRCQYSLDILSDLARRRPDLVEVVIAGRPSYTEFRAFDEQTRPSQALHFDGPYVRDQLDNLYGRVHFTWAIDYFEADANSAWLLPNRIYEGGRYGSVPLALAGVETGAWLKSHGLGILMHHPIELEAVLDAMTPARYAELAACVHATPPYIFSADLEDCRALVRALAGAGEPSTPPRFEVVHGFQPDRSGPSPPA